VVTTCEGFQTGRGVQFRGNASQEMEELRRNYGAKEGSLVALWRGPFVRGCKYQAVQVNW